MSTGYFSTKKTVFLRVNSPIPIRTWWIYLLTSSYFFEDVFVFLVHVEPEICV